jgi:tetratricopeptide (TPR) repeat protein
MVTIVMSVVCLSGSVSGQNAADSQTLLTQLAVALTGSYGDEGRQVLAVLDAMARAIPDWQRELTALQSRASGSGATSDAHVDLARAYLARGQEGDAARELTAALRSRPTDVATAIVLGQIAWKLGRRDEATSAFRAAWQQDRTNAVAAYWLQQSDSTAGADQSADLLNTLTGAYRRALTLNAKPAIPPFTVAPPSATEAGDAPLVLPAAYAGGYRLMLGGDATAALTQFREAANRDPLLSDPAVGTPAFVAGSTALRQGRISAAREQFQSATSLVPASSEAHRLLALAFLFDFNAEKSIEELEAAVRLRPDDERPTVLLARLLTQQGDLMRAESLLRTLVARVPDSSLGRLWLGTTLVAFNRDEDAAMMMTEVASRRPLSGEASLFSTIAALQHNAGRAEAASDAFMQSLLRRPNDAETHVRLARAWLDQEKPAQAFAEYVAALLIDPMEPNAYMGIGQLHLNAGRYADAVTALERLVRLQPTYNEAHYALGTALVRAGRTADGNRELAEFARMQSQAAETRRRTLAVDVLKQEAAVRTSEGTLDRAEAVWKQIIELEPNVSAHHAALAAVLLRANHLDAAATAYERAAMLGGSPDVYRQLAAIYARLGREAESVAAREKYERALLVPSTAGATR